MLDPQRFSTVLAGLNVHCSCKTQGVQQLHAVHNNCSRLILPSSCCRSRISGSVSRRSTRPSYSEMPRRLPLSSALRA